MKVLVLNGSPKGDKSITLQTVKYLELCFEGDSFEYYNAAQRAAVLEKKESALEELITKIKACDLLLFSYPVYTFMAPSQLHAVIALLKGRGCDFTGKYAAQITTSKHFYDVTAHNYIKENCVDMGFTMLQGLSADMEDLTLEEGQKQAENFWKHIHFAVEKRETQSVSADKYKIVIVTDAQQGSTLEAAAQRFTELFPCRCETVNLRDFPFQGGCLGCLKCAGTGQCVYTDNFDTFLREKIQASDAIVYAFTVTDHSMGVLFKRYDDRQFCNGHRTVLMGHPMGYIVSGDLDREENLRMIIEARAQVGGTHLAAIAQLDKNGEEGLKTLSDELLFALENKYQPPRNFYGAGGMRIFRDLIYEMQGIMRQDHRFFKEHGQYDFPQKKRGKIAAMYLVGQLFAKPELMKKMGGKIDEGMLAPYKKALEKAKKK